MRIQLNPSGVVFNPVEHTYFLEGKQLSGITAMLERQLFPGTYEGVSEQVLAKAAAYGSSVHESIEMFDSQWENDGTVEVQDYIALCKEHGLVHEASEYNVTDSEHWSSNIDKVYRTGDDTFDLVDLKTYGAMTPDKLEKARWQLSIYAYLFQLQNPKARVGNLFVMHLRNKEKNDGSIDHISDLISVSRIPSDVCKELLRADVAGE